MQVNDCHHQEIGMPYWPGVLRWGAGVLLFFQNFSSEKPQLSYGPRLYFIRKLFRC